MQTYEEGAQAAENGRESLEREEESRLEGLQHQSELEHQLDIYFENSFNNIFCGGVING